MARISLIEETEHPELAEIIGRIKAGRRGGLLNVYKLLLHSPALAAAAGLTAAECDALADWRPTGLFDPRERAALAYAQAMTLAAAVPDDVFADVRRHFDDREIVELSVLAGTYIMHNRVMNALAIDLEPESNRGR